MQKFDPITFDVNKKTPLANPIPRLQHYVYQTNLVLPTAATWQRFTPRTLAERIKELDFAGTDFQHDRVRKRIKGAWLEEAIHAQAPALFPCMAIQKFPMSEHYKNKFSFDVEYLDEQNNLCAQDFKTISANRPYCKNYAFHQALTSKAQDHIAANNISSLELITYRAVQTNTKRDKALINKTLENEWQAARREALGPKPRVRWRHDYEAALKDIELHFELVDVSSRSTTQYHK